MRYTYLEAVRISYLQTTAARYAELALATMHMPSIAKRYQEESKYYYRMARNACGLPY